MTKKCSKKRFINGTKVLFSGNTNSANVLWENPLRGQLSYRSLGRPVLQQQVVQTGRHLVVGDALTQAAVVVLLQPPVQHHLQLACRGQKARGQR